MAPEPYCPRTVVRAHLLSPDRAQRFQHLELLVPNQILVERRGRLHGNQAEKLEGMVLHHVAQRARLVIVAARPSTPMSSAHVI